MLKWAYPSVCMHPFMSTNYPWLSSYSPSTPHEVDLEEFPSIISVLEHAIMGNIVPDFPLINKSFNLSYSGHDL